MNSYYEEWNYGSNGKSSDTGVWYHLSPEPVHLDFLAKRDRRCVYSAGIQF